LQINKALEKMRKLLFVIITTLVSSYTVAQNRISENNTIGWYSTIITPSISKKVSFHAEYIWRRDNVVEDWQQSLLRLGLNYKVHPQVTLHAGYGWIETYPYGTYNLSAVPRRFPEHRIYEQVVVAAPIGKSTLQHRLRLEQRWLGRFSTLNSSKPDFIFLNRFRYMPRLDIPLNDKWYTALYDEIFIGFGKNVGENVFDQNRFSVLAGYKANKNFRLEGGFLNQVVQLGREIENKNVFQYNSGIIINTYVNF
jgi:hypothetical protein